MIRFLTFMLAVMFVGNVHAQNFRAVNGTGQIMYDLRIYQDADNESHLKVFRGEMRVQSQSSAEGLQANPLSNLSDLTFSGENNSTRIPGGTTKYFLIPNNRNLDFIELKAGDRLEYVCGFGEYAPDHSEYTDRCMVSTSMIEGGSSFYCSMSDEYGSVCQGYVLVYNRDGTVRERLTSGGVLVNADRISATSRGGQ